MFMIRALRSTSVAFAVVSFGCQMPQAGSGGSTGSAGGEGGPAAVPGRVALEQGTAGGSSGGDAADWHEEGPLPPAMTAFFEFFGPMWILAGTPDFTTCSDTSCPRAVLCYRAAALRLRAEAVRDEAAASFFAGSSTSAAANTDTGWRDGARGLLRAVDAVQGECSTQDQQSLQFRLRATKDAFHALAEHWRTTHRPPH